MTLELKRYLLILLFFQIKIRIASITHQLDLDPVSGFQWCRPTENVAVSKSYFIGWVLANLVQISNFKGFIFKILFLGLAHIFTVRRRPRLFCHKQCALAWNFQNFQTSWNGCLNIKYTYYIIYIFYKYIKYQCRQR